MGQEAIKGTVDRYLAKPGVSGYAVLSIVMTDGTRVRVCGCGIADFRAGQRIEASGSWTTHAKFGRQFRAADARQIVPEDEHGIERWLVQAELPGVDERTAKAISALFGANAVERIAVGDPRVRAILGDDFHAAQSRVVGARNESEVGPRLASIGIGAEARRAVFKQYGLQTSRLIDEDPYRLVCDVEGVGFAQIDAMVSATGVDVVGRTRLVAAVVDALRAAANDGHTAMAVDKLAKQVTRRTGVKGDILDALMADVDHHSVVATTVSDGADGVVDAWALSQLDSDEDFIANAVLDKLEEPSLITAADARTYVTEAQRLLGVELNEEQVSGAEMALCNSFCVLTGGPGTGKTTTLRVITTAWGLAAADGWVDGTIRQAAPTGKAAQRMKESTGLASMTLHRMLEVDPETGGFVHDEATPIEAGFIAIDEASMKDVPLTAAVMRAWGSASVLLLGDPDQLASVGAGRMLGDLIDSGVVPVTHLVQVRRQAEDSAIAQGAKAIREGRMPVMDAGTDFVFIECDDVARTADIVAQLHAAYLEDGCTVQALTPGHKSEVGTAALNGRLQADAALPGPAVAIAAGTKARKGDKVIQLSNDNTREIYNGDAGLVADITGASATLTLGDRTVDIEGDALSKLSLAYALTIHKSQGSEYGVVLMPITTAHKSMLKRTLVYTGLTRAKQACIVVGSRAAFAQAIANDDGKARVTTLALRLRAMAGA